MPLVLNASVVALANKEDKKYRILKTVTLFRSGTQTLNSCRSFHYVHINKSIIYVPMIYKDQQKITSMLANSTHLHVVPQQSCQNTQHVARQNRRKNQWTLFKKKTSGLFMVPNGRYFSSHNNFANLGSLQKFPFL